MINSILTTKWFWLSANEALVDTLLRMIKFCQLFKTMNAELKSQRSTFRLVKWRSQLEEVFCSNLRSNVIQRTCHQQQQPQYQSEPNWCTLRCRDKQCVMCPVEQSAKVHNARRVRLRTNSSSFVVQCISILFVMMLTSAEFVSACGPGRFNSQRRINRKLTPLVFKQYVPNVSENTLGASGANEGRITRNSKRFKELVPNYNQDIIFKDEEGTGADRLMTQRLKEKLNTLAIAVMNQWPGIKLRVLDSWVEDGKHNPDSLHYEGRAVDISTSDKDRSKYGMLARLAVDSGFDWVYYESRVHIHCSVKSEKPGVINGGCFDEKSIVYRRDGPISIKDVRINDELLTVNEEGKTQYSQVLMFLDRDANVSRVYNRIETESGATITVTPTHLLFVADDNSAQSQAITRTEFAKDIRPGQYLYSAETFDDGRVRLERVIKISSFVGRGAYAPLTMQGNLVVNNITASCYAVIHSQSLAHLSFLPVRLGHLFVQIGDYLSSYFRYHPDSTISARTEVTSVKNNNVAKPQVGIHWYARLLYQCFKYLIPSQMLCN